MRRTTHDYPCSHCQTTVRLYAALPDGHTPLCGDCEAADVKRHQEEIAKPPKKKRQGPYTDTELRAVFTMARLLLLLDDIRDRFPDDFPKLNKRAMLRALMAGPCPSRSRGSLEAKLMNVSGASQRIGGPIIPGYQPAPNCQKVMVEIARTTFLEDSDEYIDLAVTLALMDSQSKELQVAAMRAANGMDVGAPGPIHRSAVEVMTEAELRERCENTIMARCGISRTRARKEYGHFIDGQVTNPPEWVSLAPTA
jgi:hypothetical protein